MSAIFYHFFIFHQAIALQKLWKMFFLFHLKSFFRSQDIQVFVFPSSPLFLRVSHCFRAWSKINLQVYNVISCLNMNLKNILFDILRMKKGMTLKLCPLIEYQIRNIFIGKSYRKCALEAIPRPLFNFGK